VVDPVGYTFRFGYKELEINLSLSESSTFSVYGSAILRVQSINYCKAYSFVKSRSSACIHQRLPSVEFFRLVGCQLLNSLVTATDFFPEAYKLKSTDFPELRKVTPSLLPEGTSTQPWLPVLLLPVAAFLQ
jgi:hypothetical protein